MRLQTVGNGDRREILGLLYGTDLARRMIEVDADYDDLEVSGFISPTDITRPNRAQLNFFVNGRWVQDIALSSAVVQAYRGLLMVGRYPQVMLFVDLPPELVDVNVHPTKAEVRFLEPGKVFSGVQRAVRRAMLAHAPVPDLEAGLTWRPLRPDKQSAQAQAQNVLYQSSGPTPPDQHQIADASKAQQESLPRTETSLLRLVGQVGSAYLVAEAPDGLYLVDQHAAHERVLYERFRDQQTKMESQALLEPLTVELSEQQAELLEENMDLLSALGYEIEPFGPNTFKLRALPALLISADPEAALRVVVEDFEEDETPLETQRDAKLIARVCKRAAVKAGQKLSVEEQEALLRDLEACESPRTCPHGRPTMIHLSIDLLERQFGRRGAR